MKCREVKFKSIIPAVWLWFSCLAFVVISLNLFFFSKSSLVYNEDGFACGGKVSDGEHLRNLFPLISRRWKINKGGGKISSIHSTVYGCGVNVRISNGDYQFFTV